MDVRYEWNKWTEWCWMKLAWWMPKTLTYWCAIRLMAHATQGPYSTQVVPDLTAMDALTRWPV